MRFSSHHDKLQNKIRHGWYDYRVQPHATNGKVAMESAIIAIITLEHFNLIKVATSWLERSIVREWWIALCKWLWYGAPQLHWIHVAPASQIFENFC